MNDAVFHVERLYEAGAHQEALAIIRTHRKDIGISGATMARLWKMPTTEAVEAALPTVRQAVERAKLRSTLKYLRLCIQARTSGYSVAYVTDPEWLVDMAINRRAGWLEDPSGHRGATMAINGRFPKRAQGDGNMWQFVRLLNGSRWCPREIETRWLHRRIRERIVHRIRDNDDI